MKEKIYTIPVNEGFEADDECPFCFMERAVEHSAIRHVAGPGASYMEPDMRARTDAVGFCREHMKKLYDYGNALGSALILQTHMAGLLEEFEIAAEEFEMPPKRGLFSGKKSVSAQDAYWKRLNERVCSCYLCDKIEYNMQRYFETFFWMIKDEEFREKLENSKGFCLRHFAKMLEMAEMELPNSQREWFYTTVFPLMKKNLFRVKADLDWLVAKHDYRNANKPLGAAADSLQRTMQKLEGIYPADPPYKNK